MEARTHTPDHSPEARRVSLQEINDLTGARMDAGVRIFNGCTNAWLHEVYGDRVYHKMGDGWYLREARASLVEG